MIVLRLLAVVCAVVLACIVTAATDLLAFSVMGCNFNFGENPEGCINGKINEQINQAKNDANRKIDDANKKAQDAQRQADAARQELQNSPFLAKLRGEQQILQAVRSLQIEPLMQCLESARASGRTDIAQYIQRLNGNPGDFAKWVVDDIWRLVESDFDRLMAEELQALRAPSSQLALRMADPAYGMAKFRRMAEKHEGARCLLQQINPRMPDIQRAAAELQSTIRAKTDALYSQRLKPLVDEAVGKGLKAAIGASMRQAKVTLPASASAWSSAPVPPGQPSGSAGTPPTMQMAPVTPQVFQQPSGMIRSRGLEEAENAPPEEITSRGLTDVKDLFPGPGEVKDIATGVLSGYLLNPPAVHQSADRVHQLAVALDAQNRQGVPAALATVRTSLDNTFQLPAVAYLDIGIEIIRFSGHKFIDSERAEIELGGGMAIPPGGAFMVEAAIKSLGTVENTVDEVAGAACGLIPEAGAAVCDAVLWVVEKGWEWVGRPALKQGVLFGMNKAFDVFMDKVKDSMHRTAGQDANAVLDDLRRQAGPFAPLVDNLQKEAILFLAESYIKETRLAIEHYNVSVRELAEASARVR
jgi:hypothetical protein